MDLILSSIAQLLDVTNVLMLVLGVAIGVTVGAIPGLTATMAVALALPLTFGMEPITGLLLLIGIYKGGLYAGSITAILINTPGTPAAACTAIDGYPLARAGQGRKALQLALYASCVADFISNLSLILLAAQLAKLASEFGPPEYFWLIVFSLTVVISVSGRSLLRGLVSAAVGVLLATVGLDLLHGTPRFVLGFPELYDGINLVPALIGLFAIPEIVTFYASRRGAVMVHPAGGAGLTKAEFRRSLPTIIKGSLIGVVVGALPGTGATPAAFVSYAEARRSSRNRRNFGKGELEGIAAAESANNGTAGATLIPLLALGIPGDVVTAILLGAFMIHGLSAGPLLFEEHIGLIYALFAGIMLSSLVLLGVGRLAISLFARVTDVPSQILVPLIAHDVVSKGNANIVFVAAIAMFYLVVGNVIGLAPYESRMGLRNRWTLSDPEVWRRTHRFLGRNLVIATLISAPLSLILVPANAQWTVLGAAFLVKAASYLYARSIALHLLSNAPRQASS